MSNLLNDSDRQIRILIADDSHICQQIWRSYLEPETDFAIVGTAINGQEAIQLVEEYQPDIVLMDLNMPVMDGLRATEIITNSSSNTKVLILSIDDLVETIEKSLQAGARGYFLKSSQPQEIVTAIRNLDRGYYQLGRNEIAKLSMDTNAISTPEIESKGCTLTKNSNYSHHSDLVELSTDKPVTAVVNVISDSSPANTKTSIDLNFRLLVLLLLGCLTFLLILFGSQLRSKPFLLKNISSERTAIAKDSSETNILPVETIKAKLVDSYEVDRTYTGKVFSRRSSSLGFERGGKLLDLLVNPGDFVEAGKILAFLGKESLEAKQQELLAERNQINALLQELKAGSRPETLAAARSTVERLQSQLKLAQVTSQRRQQLHTAGAISREQLDIAIAEVDILQARLNESQSQLDRLLMGTRTERIEAQQAALQQMDARLASLALELEQSILKAPFTGTIGKRMVDEGTVVAAGESIFTLVEDRTLEVRVGIPVNTAMQIPVGSQQQLQIGTKTYSAKVLSTLPQLSSTTRTLTVILSIEPSAVTEVRAGQVARLKLTEEIVSSGYWLPTSSLLRGVRGLWSCYVLGSSENIPSTSTPAFRVEQRELEVLQTQSDLVFVRGTLQKDDRIIVEGTHRLVNGQLVRPLN